MFRRFYYQRLFLTFTQESLLAFSCLGLCLYPIEPIMAINLEKTYTLRSRQDIIEQEQIYSLNAEPHSREVHLTTRPRERENPPAAIYSSRPRYPKQVTLRMTEGHHRPEIQVVEQIYMRERVIIPAASESVAEITSELKLPHLSQDPALSSTTHSLHSGAIKKTPILAQPLKELTPNNTALSMTAQITPNTTKPKPYYFSLPASHPEFTPPPQTSYSASASSNHFSLFASNRLASSAAPSSTSASIVPPKEEAPQKIWPNPKPVSTVNTHLDSDTQKALQKAVVMANPKPRSDQSEKFAIERAKMPSRPVAAANTSSTPQEDASENQSSFLDAVIKTARKDLENTDSSLLLTHAYEAQMSGQYELARMFYQTVLDQSSTNETAQFGLATIYHKTGKIPQAQSLYSTILNKNPRHQGALANLLSLIGDESPENALEELRRLEAVNPTFSPLPAQIAMIYAKQKKWDQAIVYLSKALTLSPENILYRYNMAVISDRAGYREQAMLQYQQLLKQGYAGTQLPISLRQLHERVAYLSTYRS